MWSSILTINCMLEAGGSTLLLSSLCRFTIWLFRARLILSFLMFKGELSRHAVWFGSRSVYLLGHCGEEQSHTAIYMAFLTRDCSPQCYVFTAVFCVHHSVVCWQIVFWSQYIAFFWTFCVFGSCSRICFTASCLSLSLICLWVGKEGSPVCTMIMAFPWMFGALCKLTVIIIFFR